MISLDNIEFYHHPPPPKSPAHISSSSGWKSYNVSPAPQFRSHPLSPKAPIAVTSVPTSTIENHSHCAAPRNIFDIELENVSTRENNPVVRDIDLEADHQSGSQAGKELGNRCQDVSLTLVTSSMASELPVIPASTDDCEGGENQLVTRRSALRVQLDTRPQLLGDGLCSRPIATAAEADSGYSGGRSVSTVDNLPGDSCGLQSSLSGFKNEKRTITTDHVPKHHNSQLPLPALSNSASPESECRARPSQHHGIPFGTLPSKAACCGEQTRALIDSASNSPTTTPSIASSRDTSTNCEDNNISDFPSLNRQPRRKGKQLRSNSPPRRVLRSRLNTESHRHDRPPSVTVVIPVRRSASSMAGNSKHSLVQPSHRFHQASASCDSEDQPTDSFTRNHSLLTRKTVAGGEEHPRKRLRRDLTQNISDSARCHSEGCKGTFKALSGVDLLTSPVEAQEIFGRGIIRVQPHGQRHAYFLTFLPDAVDRPSSHFQPPWTPDRPLFTKRAPHISSKECAGEKGNVQLDCRQTQNQRANPKTRNHSTRHKNYRKGLPWLPKEEELLVKLKRDKGLCWSDVTRLFSEQYPGRSQGSIQVHWSTKLSKRLR